MNCGVCVPMCCAYESRYTYHDSQKEVRGQLLRGDSRSIHGIWVLKSGHQACMANTITH